MQGEDILRGKKVLVVDDEPDILDTIDELLTMCLIDKAQDFETALKFLKKNTYDVAIFDIMGVQGYDLLRIAKDMDIPAVMLTAHALSPDNLIKSIHEGAHCYIPKDKLPDIAGFVRDILEAHHKGTEKRGRWFSRLKPLFDKQFGTGWREKDLVFWNDFDAKHRISKEDLADVL